MLRIVLDQNDGLGVREVDVGQVFQDARETVRDNSINFFRHLHFSFAYAKPCFQ